MIATSHPRLRFCALPSSAATVPVMEEPIQTQRDLGRIYYSLMKRQIGKQLTQHNYEKIFSYYFIICSACWMRAE